jgi:type III pantothenate kinase
MISLTRFTVATFVDIGNTNVKILGQKVKTPEFDIKNFFDHDDFVISSVVPKVTEETVGRLRKANKIFMVIDRTSTFSFEHGHVMGVGTDLLLVAEGALTLCKPPFCVVAAGTAAVTLFVSLRNGEPYYEGGVIMPGFGMQTDMLNQRTAQLPKVEHTKPKSCLCTKTVEALNAGVCIGLTKGIEAVINCAEKELGVKLNKRFTTGGDGKFLKENSEIDFEYVEDLLFKGMESVYRRTK